MVVRRKEVKIGSSRGHEMGLLEVLKAAVSQVVLVGLARLGVAGGERGVGVLALGKLVLWWVALIGGGLLYKGTLGRFYVSCFRWCLRRRTIAKSIYD